MSLQVISDSVTIFTATCRWVSLEQKTDFAGWFGKNIVWSDAMAMRCRGWVEYETFNWLQPQTPRSPMMSFPPATWLSWPPRQYDATKLGTRGRDADMDARPLVFPFFVHGAKYEALRCCNRLGDRWGRLPLQDMWVSLFNEFCYEIGQQWITY